MTIWCMLTQIWSVTDITFCHLRPFFVLLPHYWPQKLKFGKKFKNTWRYYPFTHVYHKSKSHHVCFLRYKVQRTELFVILGHFLPFDHPNNPKNQNFEIIKKTPEDIVILHLCIYHKWQSYDALLLRYWAWQTKIFVILGYFLPFYPSNNLEKTLKKKWKKISWRYCHFTHEYHKWSIINENHMVYDFWGNEGDRQIFFSFWTIFCPFTFPLPLTTQWK